MKTSLTVVYEDDELLIFNKTSGIHCVPHSPEEQGTACSAALARCPQLTLLNPNSLEPGLLHRLDQGTSGLLVFAKTSEEFQRMKTLWKNRPTAGGISKIYRAKVWLQSALPQIPHLLETPLAHSAKSSKRMLALTEQNIRRKVKIRGKPLPARTRILQATPLTDEIADLTVQIETGVMHQIRCHLSSLGLPILGDPIYGTADTKARPEPRLWLHAWRLSFPLATGTELQLEAALPAGWKVPTTQDLKNRER